MCGRSSVVERNLAKVDVVSSNLIARSKCVYKKIRYHTMNNFLTEALCAYMHQVKLVDKNKSLKILAKEELQKAIGESFAQAFEPNSTVPKENAFKQLEDIATNSQGEDKEVLVKVLNVLHAIVRTNFFQNHMEDGDIILSFKIDPKIIHNLPKPLPLFEIFVYSANVEGVHLRFGKVARGGLRMSDRANDYRTEALALVKAQFLKNSVIVPTGSKGAFFIKKDLSTLPKEEENKAKQQYYSFFIKGILDITDNMLDGKEIRPKNVRIFDDFDPYLVVAADKGTASYSDIANSIAQEYNFWLDDAFASGGSIGYDHKKMGITAKGAWENVKRSFREMDLNIQEKDFTVVGSGGMSGDVFGNGMLLSKHIKLLGAFSGRYIFVDPNPDVAISFKERKRLFDREESWESYNKDLISQGGGIFSKADKEIKISPEMKNVFGINEDILPPNILIQKMLQARYDLLWLGGIGTYVKATQESNTDAQDGSNDMLRINAKDLQCKAVGEGANLGMTQLGRIEFSLNGGKVNTDFIDNVAGVNTSDKEVNLKILLSGLLNKGSISQKERVEIIEQLTPNVEKYVLENTYMQTQMLSMMENNLDTHLDYINHFQTLEENGLLDRKVAFLALHEDMLKKEHVTRPELCLLISYTKIKLKQDILDLNVFKEQETEKYLLKYFEKQIVERFGAEIKEHLLKNEIIATIIVNDLTSFISPIFVYKYQKASGIDFKKIIQAYMALDTVVDIASKFEEINKQDYQIAASKQIAMQIELSRDLTQKLEKILDLDFDSISNCMALIKDKQFI